MIWLTAPAFASDAPGFDAHGFDLVSAWGDLRDPVQFLRPGDVEALSWSIGGVAEYANRPVVFDAPAGGRTRPLENLVALDLAGGFSPVDRVRIDLSMPVVLTSAADGVVAGPTPDDLSVGALVAALRPEDDGGFGLGLVAALDVPTGDPTRYLGTTGVAGLVAVSSTVEVDQYTFSWLAGGRIAPNTRPQDRPSPTRGGDTIEAAGSLGTLIGDHVGVGLEGRIAVPVDPTVREAIGIPASALASLRYAVGGGYFTAGVGSGLGNGGAGASPFRVVVGGGFGGHATDGPRDDDHDGLDDAVEACPGQPETVNGYQDDDGCADELPELHVVARRGDLDDPTVAITATGADGGTRQATGQFVVSGLPGQRWTVTGRAASCFGGEVTAEIPAAGANTVVLPIGRVNAELDIAITDAAGRPLEGAEARYLVDDDACAPLDTNLVAGKGIHYLGAGPVMVFLTAPGYGVYQSSLTLAPGEKRVLNPKLAPTQVSLRDGELKSARPLQFSTGSAIAGTALELLGQMASLMLNSGGRYQIQAWAPPGGTRELSQQRAEAVLDYLVSVGVPREQLTAIGKGPMPRTQTDAVVVKVSPP